MNRETLTETRLSIIQKIVDVHRDIGKTKIQKITYFLQEAVGVPLGYQFRMHYYGPYSDSLDSVLSLAKSLGHIDIQPDPSGFGYHVTPCEENEAVQVNEASVPYEADPTVVHSAIEMLGRLETSKLELYATIHFIVGIKGELPKDEVLKTVGGLKPKFTPDYIDGTYQALQRAKLI